MRINCLNGFFIFTESKAGEVSDFMSLTSLELVPKDDYFTFKKLKDAPGYSLPGKDLLGITATKVFQGKPWEVFKANGLIYDFSTDSVKQILQVAKAVTILDAGNKLISPGLIIPGSLDQTNRRIESYTAYYSRSRGTWLYTEVSFYG